jgi:hypothetical protein
VKVKAASKAGLVTSPKKATVTKTMRTTRTSRKKQDSDSDEDNDEDEEGDVGEKDETPFRGVKQLMLNGHACSYIVPETVGEL